ncbi:uncharacterized protein TrAFT101_008475 [Trichoderma asperellum]|uniref:uncharacterized protein n=1 Tax=Trichoderma asperellum TaxID=101201 RepID=UPI00331F0201|nr:hypothetical protein TrAFT101_008475 [Trichoderma asperellum]
MPLALCDSCLCHIYDTRYTCQTCWDMDYCFKCFRHIELLQHHKNHIFSKVNSESEVVDIINPWVPKNEHGGLMDRDPSEEIHIGNNSDDISSQGIWYK